MLSPVSGPASASAALRVANCSGVCGDRFRALSQVADDGPVDVVTGDCLAELTMPVLFRSRAEDSSRGGATTFLRHLLARVDDGVASSTRYDPQAKGLGAYLRSRVVDVPVHLL